MKRTQVSLALAILALLALGGCASVPLPGPANENDCLVIIKTGVVNPSMMNNVRNYGFMLSSGGGERLFPTAASSYMAILIHEPAVKIVSIHTNVHTDRYTGPAENYPVDIGLPYRPGYAVVADFGIVQTLKDLGKGSATSWIDFPRVTDSEKAALIEELKEREGFSMWKY